MRGMFPMADPDSGRMEWFSPDPRAILPLESFHVPGSLARVLRSKVYRVTADGDFESVIHACAAPRPSEDGSWIDERIIDVFLQLHQMGFGHSIEARRGHELVAGLYGVALGGVFFGESMFSHSEQGRDGSKVCLVHLVSHLRRSGFQLLDVQFSTAHLERFGCVDVPRDVFLQRLASATRTKARWLEFDEESWDPEA